MVLVDCACMTKPISIAKFSEFVDQDVLVQGWMYNSRSSGSLVFLQVRDGSGFIQAIVSKNEVAADVWESANKLTIESSVALTGMVAKHPKKEEYELQVKNVEIYQIAAEYPIGKKEHGPDFLMENRHLWLRAPSQWAIQRVRNTVINAIYEFLNSNGFTKIDSPILTPNACEGTTTLFEVPYFDEGKAYLSQSGQLYLEAAIMSLGKVFDFGPVFRAEKSKTRRHLTEFWMMDAEMAFHDQVMNMQVQEEMVMHIIKKVLEYNRAELVILQRDVTALENIKAPFIRMTHAEAVKYLQQHGSDIKDNEDLGNDDETLLTKEFGQPVFVTHWPREIKAFYMKRDPNNDAVVLSADLIAPDGFGEIIGGAQREDDYDKMLARIKEHNLPVDAFEWYLDLRKYGSVPHAGFGLGLERTVAWMTGTRHIRETIPFPRTISRIYP